MIVEFFLSALKIEFGRFQMNRRLLSRTSFPGNGDRLTCIAHFLHGRRGLAARSQQDSGNQESVCE